MSKISTYDEKHFKLHIFAHERYYKKLTLLNQ